MAAVGRPDMGADNPLYASNSQRVLREGEIMGEIDKWVASKTQGAPICHAMFPLSGFQKTINYLI
eukprot:scaffold648902_cov46-Prasinocladus_malaysianus.AAC.1